MAFKYVPQAWRDDMRTNYNHKFNFYLNPRGRVFPAMTSAGISYIKNDAATNMRGTYRMQCGASTSLTYLYTLPQRFIIEGWFKPKFNYDVASDQTIMGYSGTDAFQIRYNNANDELYFVTRIGGASTALLETSAYTSDAELQKWTYVRAYYDNISKLKGFYVVTNGTIKADVTGIPGAGSFIPNNLFTFFPAVSAESSYWVIHELNETLATGQYKTYQADRQIIFDFNGTTLGRERIRIINRVKSLSLSKSVENPQSGSAGANSAKLTLINNAGEFSDDQYDAYDPFNAHYNGTQKYLQNRVGVEIETLAPASTVRSGLMGHWSFDYAASIGLDNSGNGNTGTNHGATSYSSGISGNAIELDGSSYVDMGDVLDIAGAQTWACWFKADTTGAIQSLMSKDGGAGNRGPWLYLADTTGRLIYKISGDGTAQTTATALGNFGDGAWHFVICRFVPSVSMEIIVDGVSTINTTAIPASQFNSSSSLQFAQRPGGTLRLTGYLDEIRIYNRAVTDAEASYLGHNPYDWGNISGSETMFMGRTTPGAFRRNSLSRYQGSVSIEAEDGVAELGETKLNASHGFDTFDLSKPSDEATSLFHSIARLVTKKEIRNYALNSGFENATIGNSWTASGLTLTRDATPQFGTYGAKAVAGSAGQYFRQVIAFTGIDLIDVGDLFNFSAYVRQGTASTVKITIEELDSVGSLIGSASETACGTDTGIYVKVDVARTILSSSCAKLRITFYATGASTFYADGVMLIRGIDSFDYYLANNTDGSSGAGSADSASTMMFDTTAFDADAVALTHPYAMIEKGDTPWDGIKDIADASLARYVGMSEDGVVQLKVAYNETDAPNNGMVEDIGSISASLDVATANAIEVHGVIVVKETQPRTLWSAESSGLATDSGGKLFYPIANNAYLNLHGAMQIECKYTEDE